MLYFNILCSFLKDKEYRDLLFTTFITLIVGSGIYHYLQGWSRIDSFYFSIITLTTIGYGYFSPQKNAGKLFTIFYIIIGIGTILSFIDTVYNHYSNQKADSRNSTDIDYYSKS